MNRPAILLAALVTFAIGLANVLLGRGLIMPLAQARERSAGVPWYIVWIMIGITALCAVALSLFLIRSTITDARRR